MSMGTLTMLAESVHGVLIGADRPFEAVSTDTRSLSEGDLFFALRGERFDASQFIDEAARRGAAGAVVEHRQSSELPQVEVTDSRRALGDFARSWRAGFQLPVIGVTGSNGKTTVKELIAAILRADTSRPEDVLATTGNLNNEIGLPLMVLRLRAAHRRAVFEMGASHAGEIDYLAGIAAPTVAVVTNAAAAHLEGFGSLDRVARAKAELFAALPADGIAVVNRDDAYFDDWLGVIGNRPSLSFGLDPRADFHATALVQENRSGHMCWAFELHAQGEQIPVRLPMAGRHNVVNTLAAAAAAVAAGASLESVQRGLTGADNVPGRLRRLCSPAGAVIYDDSYNANPASVRAAIDFLAQQPGETWLVFGDMAELGADSERLHREVGEAAAAAGIDRFVGVGASGAVAAHAFGPAAQQFSDADAAADALRGQAGSGVVALVKGSRCMGLETVVDALTGQSRGA